MANFKKHLVSILLFVVAIVAFFLSRKWEKQGKDRAKAKPAKFAAIALLVVGVAMIFKDKIKVWLAKKQAAKA